MDTDELLIAALGRDEELGLRLQAEDLVERLREDRSAEPLQDLARRIIHEPRLTPYSQEWRYLLAAQIRRIARSIPAKLN